MNVRARETLAVFALLAAATAAMFADVAFGGATFVKPDTSTFSYPRWHYAAEFLSRFEWPLWNPYNFCGEPFFANVANSGAYPPSWMLVFGDFTASYNLYVLAHVVLAGALTFRWARHLSVSREGAFLAGLSFAFSGYALSCVDFVITLASIAYFPLALERFDALARKGGARRVAALAVVLVFQFLAGDPAVSYATGLVLAAWGVALAAQKGKKRAFTPLVLLVAAAVLAALLAAFQLFPFIDWISQSVRRTEAFSARESGLWSMPPSDLAGLFVAGWHHQLWLDNYYVGLITLALATVGGAAWRGGAANAHRWLAGIGLLLAFGRYGPIFPIAQKILPFFELIRFPVRFFFLPGFALAIFAAFGYDRLFGSSRKKGLAAALVLLAWADLWFHNANAEPRAAAAALEAPTPNVRVLLDDRSVFRVMASPRIVESQYETSAGGDAAKEEREAREKWTPDSLLLYRVADVSGFNSSYAEDWADVFRALFAAPPGHPLAAALNVKYVASPLEDLGPAYRLVREGPYANVFENRKALPRAFAVAEAQTISPRKAILARLADPAYEPIRTLFIEHEPGPPDGQAGAAGGEEVEIALYSPNRVRILCSSAAPAWVFLSDRHDRGWRVAVDGKPATGYRANYAFRAVRVAAGAHEIVWAYEPARWRLGWTLTGGGFLLLALASRRVRRFVKLEHFR